MYMETFLPTSVRWWSQIVFFFWIWSQVHNNIWWSPVPLWFLTSKCGDCWKWGNAKRIQMTGVSCWPKFFGLLIWITHHATKFVANVWNMLHGDTCQSLDSAGYQTCIHPEEVGHHMLLEMIYFPRKGSECHPFQSWYAELWWIEQQLTHQCCQDQSNLGLRPNSKMMRKKWTPNQSHWPLVGLVPVPSSAASQGCLTGSDLS